MKKIKKFLSLGIPLILIISIGIFLQFTIVSAPEKITTFLSSFGPLLILVYVLIQTAGIVFPPIPGAAFQLALIAIFGPLKGLLLIYFTVTPLYCVNFLLAKKFGRPLINKLVGKNGLTKIESYTNNVSPKTAAILKILQGSYFDYVAYGLGLTPLTFKQFFWINLLGGIPTDVVTYFIFRYSPNFLTAIIIVEAALGVLMIIYFLRFRPKKSLGSLLQQIS